MLETQFPSFISKKPDEIPIFGTFLAKKSILFRWKSTFSGRLCFITSLWRHTLTDFHDFGINGKRRPYTILWHQTTILWACQFPPPLGRRVTKNAQEDEGYLVTSHIRRGMTNTSPTLYCICWVTVLRMSKRLKSAIAVFVFEQLYSFACRQYMRDGRFVKIT